jgi:G:T-mismatch repair DNA endonuclease (very short patch repair protein)
MSKRISTNEYITKAKIIHGDIYDYSKLIYINVRTKIIIICNKHGEFTSTASNHLLGTGCPQCFREKLKVINSLTFEQFISKSILVHGNKYDYSQSIYVNYETPIIIICKKHGKFKQMPAHHLRGSGCDRCAHERVDPQQTKNISLFIRQANMVHENAYDYSKSVYVNNETKLEIICPDHGSFWQTPLSHLHGSGCSKCSVSVSNKEIFWLNCLAIPEQNRQITLRINKRQFRVDAFNSTTNIIYEFYGDFWHGNLNRFSSNQINYSLKKTFGELYDKTILRENALKDAGYQIISIWESDFDNIYTDYKSCKPIPNLE